MTAQVIQMNENPLLAAAMSYAAIGWHILPAWWIGADGACACGDANCKSPGKHPIGRVAPRGQGDATVDLDRLRAWWARFPQANIAAYLEPSKLAAIDIDPRNGGYDTMEQIEGMHGKLESDLMQFTGGGGEHRIFQCPANAGFTLPGKLGPGVDVKLNGYIMLEPSNHKSGGTYVWEASSDPRDGCLASPLPDWLRDLGRSASPVTVTGPALRLADPDLIEDLRGALAALSADDYHQWVNFGLALCELGQAGFYLWDAWGQTSDKYNAALATAKWRSFKPGRFQIESIFFAAQQAGWANTGATRLALPVLSTTEAPAALDARVAQFQETTVQAGVFPPAFRALPGAMGECMGWMVRTAQRQQPMLALAATISLFATVMGTKVASPTRLRTNLYLVAVAGTSAGKDHGRKCIAKVLQAAQLEHLLGGDEIASGAGLLTRVAACPRTLFQLDEFGLMLQGMRSKTAGSHQASIMRHLMQLYGTTDGSFRGAEYGDSKIRPRVDIDFPCVNLHATTTPDQFFQALGSADITSGALNRMLILVAPDKIVPRQEPEPESVPEVVLAWVQAVQGLQSGMLGMTPGAPLLMKYEPAARELLSSFSGWLDDLAESTADRPQIAAMWGRSYEMAVKLAMIHQLASHTDLAKLNQLAKDDALTISGPSMAWGIGFVKHFQGAMQDELENRMGDSEFDILVQRVARDVRAAGPLGLTAPELSRKCAAYKSKEPRMQDMVHVALMRREDAVQVNFPPAGVRGKHRLAWVATQFATDEQLAGTKAINE